MRIGHGSSRRLVFLTFVKWKLVWSACIFYKHCCQPCSGKVNATQRSIVHKNFVGSIFSWTHYRLFLFFEGCVVLPTSLVGKNVRTPKPLLETFCLLHCRLINDCLRWFSTLPCTQVRVVLRYSRIDPGGWPWPVVNGVLKPSNVLMSRLI